MTEKQYLDIQSQRLRQRIRTGSIALHEEIERIIGPAVRDHPRISLATGVSVGLLIGRVLAPGRRSTSRDHGTGILGGSLRFAKDTGIFALRSLIVGSLASSTGPDSPPAGS